MKALGEVAGNDLHFNWKELWPAPVHEKRQECKYMEAVSVSPVGESRTKIVHSSEL